MDPEAFFYIWLSEYRVRSTVPVSIPVSIVALAANAMARLYE